MKIFCFYLLASLFCSTAFSQKWQKVNYNSFMKDYSHFMENQPTELYGIHIKTAVFETSTDIKPKTTQQSVLNVYKNNDYLFKTDGVQQIQHDALKLDIDSTEKQVVLSKGVSSDVLGYKAGQFDHIDTTKYTFFRAIENNKIYLKVQENQQLSSMQTISFVFDKGSMRIDRMEMIYWKANYTLQYLDDVSLEQPKVVLDYTDYHQLEQTATLTKEFNSWIVESSSGTKKYSCPRPDYTFHNLLEKR